jgi:hypothetical protein
MTPTRAFARGIVDACPGERLNESGKWHADSIERQLAHQEANESEGPTPMLPNSGRSVCE